MKNYIYLKKYHAKLFLYSFLLIFIVLTSACSREISDEEVKEPNPLQITGYQKYEDKISLDERGNINLIAKIDSDAQINSKYLSTINILSYTDENILVEYTITDMSPDFSEEITEAVYAEQHFTLISSEDFAILKDIKFTDIPYIQTTERSIIVELYEDSKTVFETYDYQLNQISRMELPSYASGKCSFDGKRCYYSLGQQLYGYNSENDICEEITSDVNFTINNINGVITDNDGIDYIIFWGMAADYNEYQFILNTSTNEFMWVDPMENKFSNLENNVYTEYNFDNNHWLVSVSNEKAFDYNWDGFSLSLNHNILKNKDQFFSYIEENIMYLYLYDYETADLLGSTSFNISEMKPISQESEEDELIGEYWSEVACYMSPVYIDHDTILLQLANYAGDHFFLEWNLSADEEHLQNMEIAEHVMGSSPSVDIFSMNKPFYTPEALSKKLEPLRIKADSLENKYDVEIHIGEECGNVIGGYAIEPLTDYSSVEYALSLLDKEMDRYPDHFFSQFNDSWSEGMEIYLAASLTGTSAETLGTAGGFHTIYNGKILIVLDCEYLLDLSTFHHELSHAIDNKVSSKSDFSEEKWNSLNPYDDMYTYSYQQFGYEQYFDFSYNARVFTDGKVEETYFIDSYGMTYPTEDRATLFEAVMMNTVDLEKAPNLTKKMAYYAECIRNAFNTDTWEEVPWEMNVKQN